MEISIFIRKGYEFVDYSISWDKDYVYFSDDNFLVIINKKALLENPLTVIKTLDENGIRTVLKVLSAKNNAILKHWVLIEYCNKLLDALKRLYIYLKLLS